MKRPNSHISQTLFRPLLHRKIVRSQSEGGYIIVAVGGMIVAMATLLLTAELVARVDANGTKSSGNSAAGFYAAEAGLNLRAKNIKTKFVDYNVPVGISPNTTTPSLPPCKGSNVGDKDFVCDNTLSVQDYLYPNDSTKRIPVSTYVIDQNIDSAGVSKPTQVNIGPNEPFAGLNAQEFRYDVVSTAYDRATPPNPTASLGIRFKSRLVPLFQFFAFYEKDLDISRPAKLDINGPIHTNGNLYINAAADVKLYGQLTSAGKMYRGEKNLNESCNHGANGTNSFTGKLWIKNAAGALLEMACYGTPNAEITTNPTNKTRINVNGTYVNDWGGQILPSIPKLTLPSASLVDAKLPTTTEKYDYWNKADLRIALRLDNNSAEEPVSIEVVNADKSTNAAATATLNSSTCLPTATSTNLAANPTIYANTSKSIAVQNSAIFNYGDPLRISGPGVNDFDENVIESTTITSTTPSNMGQPFPASTPLVLRRPLGKQAINSVSGVTVQKAIVWSSKTFYNYREKELDTSTTKTLAQKGRLIRMLNVDVKGIMSCAGSLMGKTIDDATEGGLIWHFTVIGPNSEVDVTKTPADSPNSYGVRLYNGDSLSSNVAGAPSIKGLTIVTDQAVYVRGDYNSINKKPASIIADSINVLSNNSPLDDRYTCAGYNSNYNASDCNTTTTVLGRYSRPASTDPTTDNTINCNIKSCTTINAAFLGGVDVTGSASGQTSGGLNNYPRLHENWSNGFTYPAKLVYRGSMVSLGPARRVNGKFGDVGNAWNIYYAPRRDWAYDTDFDNAANLPPLSPRFVYLRQERFSRDYTRTSFLPSFFPFRSLMSGNFFSVLPSGIGTQFRF